MRTTINIDSPVLDELKKLQVEEDKSLGALVSELVTQALAHRRRRRPAVEQSFRWAAKPMRARVDLEDKDALHAALDAVLGEKGEP